MLSRLSLTKIVLPSLDGLINFIVVVVVVATVSVVVVVTYHTS